MFSVEGYHIGIGGTYDVSLDDREFLMLRVDDDRSDTVEIIFVDNWAAELTRQGPN